MLKILIVDDEPLARKRLTSLLEEIGIERRVYEAEHGLEALKLVMQEQPQLLLLDIRMPVMDGLEVAQHLSRMEHPPAVIFTTAYQDHALEAFDTQAVDYLLKPVRKERLRLALDRAGILQRARIEELRRLEQPAQPRTHLSASMQGRLKLVPVKDIRYLKAEQKYVVAGWPEGELLLDESLRSLEVEFRQRFLRIHRNALIAIEYADTLRRDNNGDLLLTLRGVKTTLLVSRRCANQLRSALRSA
jgi:Response regulator of the LytR/AlgR family